MITKCSSTTNDLQGLIVRSCRYSPCFLAKSRLSFWRALKGEQGQLSNGSQLWLRSPQSRPDQQQSESPSKWLKQVLSTLNKSPIMAKTRFVHFERKSFVPTENLVGFVPTEILVSFLYVPAGFPRASSPKARRSF